MTRLILSLALALAAIPARAADDAPFSGKWQLHVNVAGNESDSTCTFTQKDKEVTGSCVSDRGTRPITGKADGKAVVWVMTTEYGGSPLTITYKGTLDASAKITGNVTVEEMGMGGEFVATQAK